MYHRRTHQTDGRRGRYKSGRGRCHKFKECCSPYSFDERIALNKEGNKYHSACRSNQAVHTGLDINYTRPMGIRSSTEVPAPVHSGPEPTTGTTGDACVTGAGEAYIRGGTKVNLERGSHFGKDHLGAIHFPAVHCHEKRCYLYQLGTRT